MRISIERIKYLCQKRGDTLTNLLAQSGVSRNAFYSLARRKTVFPRSLEAISAKLKVRPDELLTAEDKKTEEMKILLTETDEIVRKNPGVDRENVRHTLLLMREKPIERLRRALVRSR